MSEAKVNHRFAVTFVDQLAAGGVRDVCLSPGSRSAPLAMAFARHPGLRVHVLIDERSCSFFALGIAKAQGIPVALLCTSGTAAAEFHPAVVEADQSNTPLVVLTADRPVELVGVGANQAIDQGRLYGGSVRWFHDPGPPHLEPAAPRRWRRLAARALAEAWGPPAGPVHLNLAFREPLVLPAREVAAAEPADLPVVEVPRAPVPPTVEMVEQLRGALARARRPVLVAGEWRAGDRARAAVDRLRIPVLAEPSSHLRMREVPYDAMLRDEGWAADHRPDLVVRLGATMTSKSVNQWLAAAKPRTFLLDDMSGAWPDPELIVTDLYRADPVALLEALEVNDLKWSREWTAAGRRARAAIDVALDDTDLYEAHVVRALARVMPAQSSLFVGSSMPIRDVDTFWPATAPGQQILGNRGASGIDGLVSTALGMAASDAARPAVALLGDLSLYHDMNGLWAARRYGIRATVVVLDNDGGGIFRFLPQAEHDDVFEEIFATPLGLRMQDVARLYDLEFVAVERKADLDTALGAAIAAPRSTLVSVRFDSTASVAGHRACWKAVAEAIGT